MTYEELVAEMSKLMDDYETFGPGDVELVMCKSPEGVIPTEELIWNGDEFESIPINGG